MHENKSENLLLCVYVCVSSNHNFLDAYEVVFKNKIEKAKHKRKTKDWKGVE